MLYTEVEHIVFYKIVVLRDTGENVFFCFITSLCKDGVDGSLQWPVSSQICMSV